MRTKTLTLAAAAVAALALVASDASAQGMERYGQWRLRSDAPPPALNIMTYEPWGFGGMSVKIEATNRNGEMTTWGYVTLFDGVYRPVTGRAGTESAVDVVSDRMTRISTRRNGRLVQEILNVVSEDGNTIENEYRSYSEDGSVRVSNAVYERIR